MKDILKYTEDLKSFNISEIPVKITNGISILSKYLSFSNIDFSKCFLNLTSVDYIGYIYFENCKGLEFIEFPKGVRTISLLNTYFNGFSNKFELDSIYLNGYEDLCIFDFKKFDELGDINIHLYKCKLDNINTLYTTKANIRVVLGSNEISDSFKKQYEKLNFEDINIYFTDY